jgi:hypothetical protein
MTKQERMCSIPDKLVAGSCRRAQSENTGDESPGRKQKMIKIMEFDSVSSSEEDEYDVHELHSYQLPSFPVDTRVSSVVVVADNNEGRDQQVKIPPDQEIKSQIADKAIISFFKFYNIPLEAVGDPVFSRFLSAVQTMKTN